MILVYCKLLFVLMGSFGYEKIRVRYEIPLVLAHPCTPATWRSRSDSQWDECDVGLNQNRIEFNNEWQASPSNFLLILP